MRAGINDGGFEIERLHANPAGSLLTRFGNRGRMP
jgi:hypothetical protein